MKKLTAKQRKKQVQALAAIPDDKIDTSDIPELTDEQMAMAVGGRFYRPLKRPVTLRLDVDVITWLKKDGPGYQTKVNRLLREEMLRTYRSKAKRKGTLVEFLMSSPLRSSGIEIKRLGGSLRKVDL